VRIFVFDRWHDPDGRPRVIAEVVDECQLELAYGYDAEHADAERAAADPEYASAVAAWRAGDDTRNEAARAIGAAEMIAEAAWEATREYAELRQRWLRAWQRGDEHHAETLWRWMHPQTR